MKYNWLAKTPEKFQDVDKAKPIKELEAKLKVFATYFNIKTLIPPL